MKQDYECPKCHLKGIGNCKCDNVDEEFQELLDNGDIQERTDGFGSFCGYDDEAGHIYSNKEEVIEKFGLGK